MNAEVKLHPSTGMLNQFVQGELATGPSVIVSAHMELCKSCGEKAKELQAFAVSAWVDPSLSTESATPSEAAYSTMMESIVKSPQVKSEPVADLHEVEFEVMNTSISLPRVLAKAAGEGLKWQRAPGGISEANLFLDDETQCEFIYMAPGSRAPAHTHSGSETTLILHGSFFDDMGEYKKSDFIVRDTQHQHQPATEEGCLCFAVLDSPLKFTKGLARLLNPYNRYKFKRAISRAA